VRKAIPFPLGSRIGADAQSTGEPPIALIAVQQRVIRSSRRVGMVNFESAAAEGDSRIDLRLGARAGEPLYCRRAFMLEFPA